MPILQNPRHELFAHNLAAGPQERVYTAAGYKAIDTTTSALGTKPHIKERVTELQTRNIMKQDELVDITTQRLVAMAEAARVKAMQQSEPAQPSAIRRSRN